VAALTFASGLVVALRMTETHKREPGSQGPNPRKLFATPS
jgi:hypothetical protein